MKKRHSALVALLALTMAFGAVPRTSWADDAPKKPTKEALDEALNRFNRGVALVSDGDYTAALLEFRRAYTLAPTYKLLFNIGQVSRALNDYAGALQAYEQYLREGGANIPPEQATEVRAELDKIRSRVAKIIVATDVVGAEVSVDDLVVGKTPLAGPLNVNAGRRKISVSAGGRVPETHQIEVAGTDTVTVRFTLPLTNGGPSTTVTPPPKEELPPPSRVLPVVLWSTTGAFVVGSAVVGVLALKATSDFVSQRGQVVTDPTSYNNAHSKSVQLSVASDVLTAAAIVNAGFALYFTLKGPSSSLTSTTGGLFVPRDVSVGLGPGNMSLRSSF